MDFVGAIKAGFKNYVVFKGTATRPEYWYWVLFAFLVAVVTNALDGTGTFALAFSLATLLPGLAVTVRRLRDAGFSWTWLLLPVPGFFPFVYGVVLFVDELIVLGIDETVLDNPELIDQAFLRELIQNEVIMSSFGIILLSLLYIGLTSILVNLIFPIQRSKTFEQGNKRLAPNGPETPAL
jgi:uncharacterized membrane protein YhaH (DUF805 family)